MDGALCVGSESVVADGNGFFCGGHSGEESLDFCVVFSPFPSYEEASTPSIACFVSASSVWRCFSTQNKEGGGGGGGQQFINTLCSTPAPSESRFPADHVVLQSGVSVSKQNVGIINMCAAINFNRHVRAAIEHMTAVSYNTMFLKTRAGVVLEAIWLKN